MAINASEFNSNYATVYNLSKGDCKVNCLVKFKYKILGEGNIYLKGNPPEIIDENPSSIKKVIVEWYHPSKDGQKSIVAFKFISKSNFLKIHID